MTCTPCRHCDNYDEENSDLRVQNAALLEVLKRAQNYILNHCHPLMPADRRSAHVPATISARL